MTYSFPPVPSACSRTLAISSPPSTLAPSSLLLDKLKLVLLPDNGVDNGLEDKFDAALGIVIAWNDVINGIRVAVGIDQRQNGKPKLPCLCHSQILMTGIDNDEEPWKPSHAPNTRQVLLELLLRLRKQGELLLRQAIAAGGDALSMRSSFFTDCRMVARFVSVPPSHRSLT